MEGLKNNKGFTLVELLIVIFIIGTVFVCAGVIGTAIMGNQWYTETGVLRKIQLEHPAATEIIDTQRNVWRYSVITVREDAVNKKYYLDTNILFNYKVYEKTHYNLLF